MAVTPAAGSSLTAAAVVGGGGGGGSGGRGSSIVHQGILLHVVKNIFPDYGMM